MTSKQNTCGFNCQPAMLVDFEHFMFCYNCNQFWTLTGKDLFSTARHDVTQSMLDTVKNDKPDWVRELQKQRA